MNNLGINWFDLFVLAMLVVGIYVGRKRGMSLELLSVLQWLMIVFVAAITCEPFGKMLAELSGISPVLTYTAAYLLAAILIKIVFIMILRMAGEKLVASDVFGNFEYYLGMAAGLIYIPPFGSIQRAVFDESMTGRAVKQYLSAELINVDPAAGKGVARESIGRRRERDVNDVISPK